MTGRALPRFLFRRAAPSVAPRVVFVPNRGYHIDALSTAIPKLKAAGVRYGFCLERNRHDHDEARAAMERLNEPPLYLEDLRERAEPGDVWVLSLDTRVRRKEIIDVLRPRGVTIIGVQEGCRPSMRNRYRYVDHVFVWGRYAAARFEGRSTIVGSPRLETLKDRVRHSTGIEGRRDVAVINFKLTMESGYETRARHWLNTALDAVAQCGMRPLVSKHFFSSDVPESVEVYEGAIEDVLLRSGILISRPSTTIFEAMVLERQPFLFPFEDDPLCEFHDPRGAFPICWDGGQLLDALRDHLAGRAAYRSSEFLGEVFDDKPDEPAGDRMAEAILSMLA